MVNMFAEPGYCNHKLFITDFEGRGVPVKGDRGRGQNAKGTKSCKKLYCWVR